MDNSLQLLWQRPLVVSFRSRCGVSQGSDFGPTIFIFTCESLVGSIGSWLHLVSSQSRRDPVGNLQVCERPRAKNSTRNQYKIFS